MALNPSPVLHGLKPALPRYRETARSRAGGAKPAWKWLPSSLIPARLQQPLLLAAVLVAAPASAADNPDIIEQLTVTGTRLAQTPSEIGSSFSVITAEDLETLGTPFLLDALATSPGVTVNQTGAFGGLASIRIRGASTAQTLVLIDGMPVNDVATPAGGFDFARLDPEHIDRVEILRGAQSTLWGTDAIGGVTAITTRRPKPGISSSFFGEYGSFATFRGGASVGFGGDRGDLRLALSTISSDGISKADAANGNDEEDGYDASTLSARGGVNLGGGARLALNLFWNEADTAFDSFAFGAEGGIADGDQTTDSEELVGSLLLDAPLFDERLQNQLLIGRSELERTNFTDGSESFNAEGNRLLLRYQGTLELNPDNTIAFGLERENTEANRDDTHSTGLFALYELKPAAGLTLTAGLRNDDHDVFGSETTGRVAIAWHPTPQLILRSSWGQGFKAPTLFQTTFFCCGALAANPDVAAETSESLDVGIEWRELGSGITLGATLFTQDTDNEIIFDFLLGGYANRDEVRSRGVELNATLPFGDAFGLTGSYSWIDAEDGAGNDVFRLPEHSGTLSLSYDAGGAFSGALLLRHNGAETNTDGSRLDAWTRLDLTARYLLNDRLELYARIENLADASYQQILGFGTPGRSGTVGVRLRY